MIKFCDVTLHYHYDPYPLFENLSFTLAEGTNTILCDIQSGKTSLCKLILGQVAPNSGMVLVDGAVSTGKTPSLEILYLPQQPTFFPNKSVLFNLQYPLKVRKLLKQHSQLPLQLAQQFGLENLLGTKVKKLDVRQKKLLALARGLTVPRQCVLFDGFFDDTSTIEELSLQNVLQFFQTCPTVVVLTTKPRLATGNTVVLDGGKCVFEGTPSQAQEVVSNLEWLAERI